MLEILDVEGLNEKDLNINRRKTNKTQILLYDTGRRFGSFISKLKYRKNGKYDNVPHFIVTKSGQIYKVFNPDHYSNTFGEPSIDKKFIKVAVENLGWLRKNTINGLFVNWIGDIYRGKEHVKSWRNYFYWDRYENTQMIMTSILCDYICDTYNIEKRIVPSQGYTQKVLKFKGVVCKSNFSSIYTDINPSFNFKEFFKDEYKQKINIRPNQKDAQHTEES